MLQHRLKKVNLLFWKTRKKIIRELPSFLNRLSTLISEGYTFSDSVNMLLPYHVDNIETVKATVEEMLYKGEGIVEILERLSVPKYYLVGIKIAEQSGEVASALKNTALQMDFNEKMKKKLGTMLLYPVILFVFLTGIFIAFRTMYLPNIEQIINTRSVSKNSTDLSLSKLFLHVPDYLLSLAIVLSLVAISVYLYLKRKTVEMQMAILLKIPVVKFIYKLQITRILSRSLGSLIVGGFSLQQALSILKQQQLNLHLSFVSTNVEKRIIYGDSLSSAISNMPCFFSKFEEFIKHGEKSGYLGRELMIYCDLLDEKLQSIIKTTVAIIQPILFIIIAVCIIAAYLSILMPMYNLIEII